MDGGQGNSGGVHDGDVLVVHAQAERGAENLRDAWEWRPACDEFFTTAAEALKGAFPERVRGMQSHSFLAAALNLWGGLQVRAGTDPLTVAGTLGSEAAAAIADDDAQGEFLRQAELNMFVAWLERDALGALEWFASGNDLDATVLMLEKVARAAGVNGPPVVEKVLATYAKNRKAAK